MSETVFEELKRYVGFDAKDEQRLTSLYAILKPEFPNVADVFYQRILENEGARKALEGGETRVGRLKVTLVQWLEKLFQGPYDDSYYELRARIGRMHVRISLPQHYMLGAMNVVREELGVRLQSLGHHTAEQLLEARSAIGKMLDLELAIMLHTYREDLLAQSAKSERLATFGQLVGSIGHELRNPLGVIETSLFLLKSRSHGDERTTKHLDRIGEQLQVANDIITQLLDMVRDRPLLKKPVALKAVVEKAMDVVKRPEGVKVHLLNLDDAVMVEGDATLLGQVLVNLLENAVFACGASGTVRVEGLPSDHGAMLVVEDSGAGVDPSVLPRLFEPLVSNKERGIGLGLALVKRIVERHGGSISYSKGSLGGARFFMQFPRGQ